MGEPLSESQASDESSKPPAQVAVYDGGRIALVRRGVSSDPAGGAANAAAGDVAGDVAGDGTDGRAGHLGLPQVPGWNGNAWHYPNAIALLGSDVPAPLAGLLTHLTPLRLGEDGPAVNLVEARTTGVAADGWWSAGDQAPPDVPAAAARALDEVLQRGESRNSSAVNEPAAWPPFCRPGLTRALGATIRQDPRLAGRVSLRCAADEPLSDHDLEQLQGWGLSSVWANRELVLKLTHPAWPAEAPVTRLLAEIAPHIVPRVVTTGQVAEIGGPYLAQVRVVEPPDPDESDADLNNQRTAEALLAMADLQVLAARHTDELTRAGVKVRTAATTATQLPDLWQSLQASGEGEPGARIGRLLSEEQRDRLPELDRLLRRDLATLESVPLVLVHGDLHLGNVMQDEAGRPQLIDWTDAAFAWPGVDLWMPLSRLTLSAEQREELVQAYLDRLGRTHELGVRTGYRVAPVYHALSNLEIARFLPPELRDDFHGYIGWLLRKQFAEYGL